VTGSGVTSGLSVLEFGDSVATAYCGKLFADYGADVLKVELPCGDGLRAAGPFKDDLPSVEGGGLFGFLNTSKQSVTIDWRTSDGLALTRRLAESVDVVVHPFRAEGRTGFAFDAPAFRDRGLVEVAITPFGQDGPYARYEAEPLTMAALGGWMHAMGDPDKPPLYPGGPYISYLAGVSGAIGAMLAVEARQRGGQGQLVDVSEFETAIGCLPFDTVQFSYSGGHRRRTGDLYGDNPLAAIYPCADGYVQFQVSFRPAEFLRMVGGEEMANDPRFQNAELRSLNRETLREAIVGWLADKRRWDLFDECGRDRLVFSAVPDVSELLTLPPHVQRGFFQAQDDGALAGVPLPGPAIRFSDGAWDSRPAPTPGEANDDILRGRLGVAKERLWHMRQAGII
jgi:crotonobetainyl-CoA:carnitine CoA-transferase CaiB-like acyl-CoA transferase